MSATRFLPAGDLPQVPKPEGYRLRDVQLEMSLKMFYDLSAETREAVCAEVFHQWHALLRHAETVSVLLWIGDGSEILEYEGDLERVFAWGSHVGSANAHEWKLSRKAKEENPDDSNTGVHAWDDAHDPGKRGLHRRSYPYRENPAQWTFHLLRELVADIRRVGEAVTGKRILVGETFDIGPEFSVSRFKYEWHPEILAGGNSLFKGQWVSCESVLNGDNRKYAAYPEGIPDQTPFGTFFGRQLERFFRDIGFDFLWLSNGFGFALEPWAMIGNLFDGLRFHPEAAEGTRERILKFWDDLRREFPAIHPIRTRGTNLATGIDLGSDASPLRDIYAPERNVDAPVNSPWAALDHDFGLELSGWMSHVARHPGETFRFRYYIHDPWWMNSPYLDRYERNPHDIFLPSSVSRVRADGSTEIARDIAFLSIDDSRGTMPLSVPNEVTAHLLRAREFAPDAPGPLVWLYPFDAFHDLVEKEGRPEIPFHADMFIGTVINDSVPLNTVMDLGDCAAATAARPDLFRGRVLLSPVPQPGTDAERTLVELGEAGASLLLYGPVPDNSAFLHPLGLELSAPLEGDFDLALHHVPDGERTEGVGRRLRHTGFLSAGGFRESPRSNAPESLVPVATASSNDGVRLAAAIGRMEGGGRIAWTRASLATREYDPDDPEPIRGPILRPMNPAEFLPPGRLARFCLDALGWRAACADFATEQRPPYVTIHRHRNAFHYSGYHADENAVLRLRHPLGAPLMTFRTTRLVGGMTELTGTRAWSYESRVFVESGGDGPYRCRFLMPVGYEVHRRLLLKGCRDATLHFLPEPDFARPIRILRNPVFPYFVWDFVEPVVQDTPHGPAIRIENVNGTLMIEF